MTRFSCLVVAAVVLAMSAPMEASPASRERTREAFAHAYELNFAEAYKAFAEAAALDASDPAPPRGAAAIAWIETLFMQGVATFEAFTGQVSTRADVVRPRVPAALTKKFRTHLDHALLLAQRRLDAVTDADAYYQSGMTDVLSALHMATVDGRTLGSFGAARRGVRALERARALDPAKRETALVLGMSRYTVSTMAAPVRLLARMMGLAGGREEGIALLEEAASPGTDTEADAALILMIVYNREGRHSDALARVSKLRAEYPSNRLLALNEGVTALDAGLFDRAERRLGEGLEAHPFPAEPVILGEEALWRLKLGTARAALRRTADAERDLLAVLTLEAREWVRGRAHAELGKLALLRPAPAEARRHFTQALRLAERSGDGLTVRQVQRLLKKTPR